MSVVSGSAKMFIPMADIVDVEKERERLNKEKANAENEIKRLSAKLSNPGFTDKAPAAVVDGERAKLAKFTEMLKNVTEMLTNLG